MLEIGVVLTRKDDDGKEHIIAYASRSNNDAEIKYSFYKDECLAIVWAIAHFCLNLYGHSFTLVIDYKSL
jgi:hypothetical protein